MLSRKNFITFVIVTYLVLLIFFFAFKDHQTKNNACMFGRTCIRFCCEDEKLCKKSVIQTHFNASELKTKDENDDYIILFGEPACASRLERLESNKEWQFTDVSLIN